MCSRSLLLLLFFLASNCLLVGAEMISATFNFEDGTIKKGAIEFPLLANAETVKVIVGDGKTELIKSELLKSIDLRLPTGPEYHLERIYVNTYDKKHKETFTSVNQVWAYRLRTDSKMDYFTIGSEYRIRKKEQDMEVISEGSLGQVMHSFQRPGEEGATAVHSSTGGGVIVGTDKYFLNSLLAYFSDTPALAQRIADEEFKKASLLSLYEAYCE